MQQQGTHLSLNLTVYITVNKKKKKPNTIQIFQQTNVVYHWLLTETRCDGNQLLWGASRLRQLQIFYRGQELPKFYYLTTIHIKTRLRRKQLFVSHPTYCIFSFCVSRESRSFIHKSKKCIYRSFLPHISNQSNNLVRSYQVGSQATSLYAIKLLSNHLCNLPSLDQTKIYQVYRPATRSSYYYSHLTAM